MVPAPRGGITLGGVLALPPLQVHVALTHGSLQSIKGDECRVVMRTGRLDCGFSHSSEYTPKLGAHQIAKMSSAEQVVGRRGGRIVDGCRGAGTTGCTGQRRGPTLGAALKVLA